MKKNNHSSIIIVGILALSLFFWLDLTGVDEQNNLSSAALPATGVLPSNAKTDSIPSAFADNNMLFVFWKGATNNYVYYTYYNGSSWSGVAQVSNLKSGWGVEAFKIIDVDNNPYVCLFLKGTGSGDGSITSGAVSYSCASLAYTNNIPTFGPWSTLKQFSSSNNVDGMVSSTTASEESKNFDKEGYAAYDFSKVHIMFSSGGSLEKHLCTKQGAGALGCSRISSATHHWKNPSLVDLPAQLDLASADTSRVFTFFRNQDNELNIAPTCYDGGANCTIKYEEILRDVNDAKLKTQERADAHVFGRNVAVAYKITNTNNINALVKSDVGVADSPGLDWVYCSLGQPQSLQAPTLFEYAGALYLLYTSPQTSTQYLLSYMQIDGGCRI